MRVSGSSRAGFIQARFRRSCHPSLASARVSMDEPQFVQALQVPAGYRMSLREGQVPRPDRASRHGGVYSVGRAAFVPRVAIEEMSCRFGGIRHLRGLSKGQRFPLQSWPRGEHGRKPTTKERLRNCQQKPEVGARNAVRFHGFKDEIAPCRIHVLLRGWGVNRKGCAGCRVSASGVAFSGNGRKLLLCITLGASWGT